MCGGVANANPITPVCVCGAVVMVVIDTEPWREGERTAEEKRQKAAQDEADKQLFGFQDLASDYYQVIIIFSNLLINVYLQVCLLFPSLLLY